MRILPLALPTQSNQGEQPHTGIAALINCYAVPAGEERKSQVIIRAAAGLDALVTMSGTGGVRGILEVDGSAYVVVGRTLHLVDSLGSDTVVGGIPSDGHVGMARNQRAAGVQVAIVSDGLGYIAVGNTLSAITDTDLPPPFDVCCINQSFIFAASDGRMHRSEINDGFSVDALDVATAESSPDGLLRVVDRGSDLIAIGGQSTEVWTDTGGEAFGFSRAATIRVGAVGPRAVTKATVLTGQVVTDTVAWVATDGNGRYAGVVMLSGFMTQLISNSFVDEKIDAVADKSSIIASAWVERGRGFISFRLPTTTLVYDTSTSRWHERQSRTSAGAPTTWRVGHVAVLTGKVLAGDADNPKLYWLDPMTYDEDGDELIVTVRTPSLTAYPGRIECNHLYLDAVPGVGAASGASVDTDPVISLRMSRDNVTWGSSRDRNLGQAGDRLRRVSWTGLGTFDAATFEFSCSAAVVRELMSAGWDGAVLKP